jgi:hypothetical protein
LGEIDRWGELDMRKTSSIAMLVIAFFVFASSCGGGGFAKTPSSEWVTIAGRNVSLRLPPFFKGGDPADPAVMSILQGMAESRSNPQERESLVQWLDDIGRPWINAPSLMAWAAPDDGGPIASVTVGWSPLQNLLVLSDGDSSMRALVDAYMFGQTPWKLDSLKADEASVIVRDGYEGADASAEFTLIRVVGDLYYTVRYSCRETSWDVLYDTFKESSETFDLTF